MPLSDHFILMGVGGIFIVLGIVLVLWGRGERRGYYSSLAARPDAREFLEHWPQRPRIGAGQIGGWISLSVGLVLVVVGGVLWFLG
jgi:hypothetical protein